MSPRNSNFAAHLLTVPSTLLHCKELSFLWLIWELPASNLNCLYLALFIQNNRSYFHGNLDWERDLEHSLRMLEKVLIAEEVENARELRGVSYLPIAPKLQPSRSDMCTIGSSELSNLGGVTCHWAWNALLGTVDPHGSTTLCKGSSMCTQGFHTLHCDLSLT